jgi:hypothetical protein
MTREWRKFPNEELRDLYSSPSIIKTIKSRRMSWTGHVTRMWKKRNAYRLLVGKPEGKRPLGRPRRGWVDNTGYGKLATFFIRELPYEKGSELDAPFIRMALGEVGWGDVDWIGLAQDRNRWRALVNSVLYLRVP